MYERTFVSGEANELVAKPIERTADVLSVGIYKGEEYVAVKECDVIEGLIVRQSMHS
jgi:ribosomal protein L14